MINHKAKGKKSRLKGKAFEVAVGKLLTEEGWIVTKWRNQVDLESGKIIPAKNYYIPGRGNVMGSGFPDYVAFQNIFNGSKVKGYILRFIECKMNDRLDKKEKQQLDWLVKQGHKCFVAYQDDKEIKFRKFLEYKERAPAGGIKAKRNP